MGWQFGTDFALIGFQSGADVPQLWRPVYNDAG